MFTFKQFLAEIVLAPPRIWKGTRRDIARALAGEKVSRAYLKAKDLPGNSGLKYNLIRRNRDIEVLIFDSEADEIEVDKPPYSFSSEKINKQAAPIVGHMRLSKSTHVNNCYQVEMVSVISSHRGRKIGLALYGIVLDILKLSIVSDEKQTKDGAKMWAIMKNIPGVRVFALYDPDDYDFEVKGSGPFVDDMTYSAAPVSIGADGNLKADDSRLKLYGTETVRLIAKKVN